VCQIKSWNLFQIEQNAFHSKLPLWELPVSLESHFQNGGRGRRIIWFAQQKLTYIVLKTHILPHNRITVEKSVVNITLDLPSGDLVQVCSKSSFRTGAHVLCTESSLRIRRLDSGNEKRPVIKSKRFFFKEQCSIYIF